MASEENLRKYRNELNKFMNYTHGTSNPKDHVHTQEELLTITPEQLVKYFNFKVYGQEEPQEGEG